METIKLTLSYHKRQVNKIRYNEDADLIFSCSADRKALCMNSDTLEVLGVYSGHEGAVLDIYPTDFTAYTSSADLSIASWDVETGNRNGKFESNGIARGLTAIDKTIYFCTDSSMQYKPYIGFIDPNTKKIEKFIETPNPNTCIFSNGNYLIVGDKGGFIYKYNIESGEAVFKKKYHAMAITSLSLSRCKNFFVSTSTDCTFLIIDFASMEIKKRFQSSEAVNSAVIHPENEIIISVGGVDAKDLVFKKGKSLLETSVYDIVTTKKLGSYSVHNGTIYSVDVAPGGNSIVSGGNDGQICLIKLGGDFSDISCTKL